MRTNTVFKNREIYTQVCSPENKTKAIKLKQRFSVRKLSAKKTTSVLWRVWKPDKNEPISVVQCAVPCDYVTKDYVADTDVDIVRRSCLILC